MRNEVPDGLPQAHADYGKIQRVLINLVDNALKYTPSGEQVTVSAARYGTNAIMVKVFDSGPGVPEEFREKIFERFSQVPGQRGRTRGSGLGLTFCRLAVRAHGGRIWVEPRSGGGSVFAFTLPTIESL
jgi:signal transduction histidine kinase